MEIERDLEAPCPASVLFPYVADLGRYPEWMSLVHAVTPSPSENGPAWDVEIRAALGPLARSKRLRMARTVLQPDEEALFERVELDGRHHAAWVLRARLEDRSTGTATRTRLRMHLGYHGALWTGGVLERVLDDHVRRGSERLLELVTAPTR